MIGVPNRRVRSRCRALVWKNIPVEYIVSLRRPGYGCLWCGIFTLFYYLGRINCTGDFDHSSIKESSTWFLNYSTLSLLSQPSFWLTVTSHHVRRMYLVEVVIRSLLLLSSRFPGWSCRNSLSYPPWSLLVFLELSWERNQVLSILTNNWNLVVCPEESQWIRHSGEIMIEFYS